MKQILLKQIGHKTEFRKFRASGRGGFRIPEDFVLYSEKILSEEELIQIFNEQIYKKEDYEPFFEYEHVKNYCIESEIPYVIIKISEVYGIENETLESVETVFGQSGVDTLHKKDKNKEKNTFNVLVNNYSYTYKEGLKLIPDLRFKALHQK